jgi:hypothetical protein
MRRVWVVIVSAMLVTTIGCGKRSYDLRLASTLEDMKYKRRLKDNLMEPPTDKKFQELTIYLRAPKELALAKAGQLPVTEGQFDLDASFNDKADANLHVLARVKMPKKPLAKGAPPPPTLPPRNPSFEAEVLGVLANVFGAVDGLQTPKFSMESTDRSKNQFKRLIFPANEKEVKVYIYKQGNHEVALIFVYDPKLKIPLNAKIPLCLDSFATGARAGRLYSGGGAEEDADTSSPTGPV